ncbi:MAG: DinB family protein [Pseudomonadota bacterium]
MKSHFTMFARYNAWANTRLYDASATLPDAQYRENAGAFFGSLHNTLNHLLLGDRIWMRRFTGSGDHPDRLDAILFDAFDALRAARMEEDRRITSFVDGLGDADLSGTFKYRTISQPADIEQPLAPALAHFFNHQTHHRGQAHTLLTRLTGTAPSFDLILFQRETGIGLG